VLSEAVRADPPLVFSQTVGAGCLGTAYVTATRCPTWSYELVLGGALTSAMNPAPGPVGGAGRSDPAERAPRQPDLFGAADLVG